jgi:hypothetical protein
VTVNGEVTMDSWHAMFSVCRTYRGLVSADQAVLLRRSVDDYDKLGKLLRSWEDESERLIDATAARER